jgi:ribosomal protein S26
MAAVKVVIAIAGISGLMLPEKKVVSKLSIEGVDLESATTHNYEKAFIFTEYQCEKHYIRYHFTIGSQCSQMRSAMLVCD